MLVSTHLNFTCCLAPDKVQLSGALCLKQWYDFDLEILRNLNAAKAKVLKRSDGDASASKERAAFSYAYLRQSSQVKADLEYVLPGSATAQAQKVESVLSWQNENPTSWPTAATLDLDYLNGSTKELEQRISVQIPERKILRTIYRETVAVRGERVFRREIDAWPFKFLSEYNTPSGVLPAGRSLLQFSIECPDDSTLVMNGTGNYGDYKSTAAFRYASGRSLELSLKLDQTTPPTNAAERFEIDYTLRVTILPHLSVNSEFRGGLPVQHDLRLAPGSVRAELPNGLSFSGTIRSVWPEVEVSVTSNHELIADSKVRIKLEDTQLVKTLELELHNRYLARTYAPSSASQTLLFSTVATLDLSDPVAYSGRALGSMPVCAFVKDYNVSARLLPAPDNFAAELALRYGAERSKRFEAAISFAREERGISAAGIRVAASEFPFLSNVKLAYSNDFSGRVVLVANEQRNAVNVKRAPNLEIDIDLPTLQLRQLNLSLKIEGTPTIQSVSRDS